MERNQDISINDNFGSLIVKNYCKGNKKGCWECECICGKICYANSYQLTYGLRKGCGCLSTAKHDNLKRGVWEDWEIAFLILSYPLFDIVELSEYLNRPPRNVAYCLNRRKIHKTIKSEVKVDDIFQDLKVIELHQQINKSGRIRKFAVCECKCGNTTNVRVDSLLDGATKSCGCGVGLIGNKSPKWKGYQEISGSKWLAIQKSASKRSIAFDIAIEDAWQIFKKQNRKCNLSNLEIYFAKTHRGKFRNETTASLDRVDSSIGYENNNVQWLHRDINKMKWEFEENYFIKMCGLVFKNNCGEEYDDKTNDWW